MFKITKTENLAGEIYLPGNAMEFKTGNWRSRKPVWIKENCKQCTVCWPTCPEDCILIDSEQKVRGEFDYEYCKGCGICAKVCPFGAIVMVEEEEQ